ncbi:hypothetical protein QAD02_000314 [Eretmocerus hayati]|uniref:Uncharacterized protein n=1 Tax=Eretmocerus hayati TaxID=131215 RepID=A0ACC2ND25_9HYME|nr:hypothetical protein QAD02_000314 [Eretmocerus hayati]
MSRSTLEETVDPSKGGSNSGYVKQEQSVTYASYDASSYVGYGTGTSTPQQPLPGQPPLPPMPPPQAAVPPPPSVFAPVATQVAQLHAWPHQWQWITPQAGTLAAATQAAAAAAAFQRDVQPMRNNYVKRERFNHNRNNAYQQRGNFHRKNRHRRYDQGQNQYHDQGSYYGAGMGMDWQRGNEAALMGMQIPMPSQLSHMAGGSRRPEESGDQDIKEEIVVKKNKQRKPMSMSYPSRPWNREDAERALRIESEYNKAVRAQSLIIKFPDPDLSKDIVKQFHSGIQNIHFQSPSGPRYCFVQMSEGTDIDEAIKELEKVKFGVGHLRVERKSLRDEDNPAPEEIDPYTLYIGNLPESVNVNEVKNKFPTAARVDVGYAQKMRNTRYAFIRYNSIDESIAAYKKAHDLMWDTRSIIVRFRRQRGNTCLPGEQKSSPKKKDEVPKTPSATNSTKKDDYKSSNNRKIHTSQDNSQLQKTAEGGLAHKNDSARITESPTVVTSSVAQVTNNQEKLEQSRVGRYPDYTKTWTIYPPFGNCHLRSSLNEDSRRAKLKDDVPSDHLDQMFSDLQNIAGDIGF